MSSTTFDATQLTALASLCDTFVPSVRPPDVQADDPHGFWARRATDLDVPQLLAVELGERLTDEALDDLRQLLDLLATMRFARFPLRLRETIVAGLSAVSSDAAAGLHGLCRLTLYLSYGTANDGGRNPNWDQIGYPGPPATTSNSVAPAVLTPPDDDAVELRADVVVVGSGAGGGVIAGELASSGVDVVVLEAGTAYNDADFPGDEYRSLRDLYWRRGLNPTEDGNVAMLAGATLGGGTTINWQNCVQPPQRVRAEWADDHGMVGLDGPTFDAHLQAVAERLGVTSDHSDLNGPNQRLSEGAKALGLDWHVAARNSGEGYDAASAGHVGYGDRSGAKQGMMKTYLADAVDHDARIVVEARVSRVLVENGRAAGVVGTLQDGRAITVHAGDVVVAAGALETPGVLLRSGIGGNAVGNHLRLHPVPMMVGVYAEPQRAWWGPPQAAIVDQHADVAAGFGYLVETPHQHPGVTAMSFPWRSGRDHKLIMGRSGDMAGFIAVQRDHGSGHVVLDADGETQVHYPWDDAIDAEVTRHALATMITLHEAAGARTIIDMHPSRDLWQRGQRSTAPCSRRVATRHGQGWPSNGPGQD